VPIHRWADGLATGVRTGVFQDLDLLAAEDLIGRRRELAAAVTYQRLGAVERVTVAEEQVAGCLGGPFAGRMGRGPGVEHAPRRDVYEEQQVVAAQHHGVDTGEVTGHRRLRPKEVRPGHRRGLPSRGDVAVAENLAHRRCTDAVTKPDELAVDPPVTSRRIVSGHLDHQSTDHRCGGWPPRASRRVGPVTGHPWAVPPQQGLRGDDPPVAKPARQRLGDRTQQSPVIVSDSRSRVLTS